MRDTVLIVEDVELNREILSEMIDKEYKIIEASNGIEALEAVNNNIDNLAVMLLDLVMPKMGGLEVIEKIQANNQIGNFPILIITSENSIEIEEKCLNIGAFDFIKKPFNPSLVQHRINNAISLYRFQNSLVDLVNVQTQKLTKQADELKQKNQKLKEINENTIEAFSEIVEARNLESGTHVKRVKGYSRILAEKIKALYPEYNLTDEDVELVSNASSMHDIGKITVPDNILLKPGRLTPEEFDVMKKHTTSGAEILKKSKTIFDDNYYEASYDICRYHHEKYDGRGYPDGLKGDDIPIFAQIVSIADCFDALTTDRCYKKAFSYETAQNMINNNECGMFNPKLLDCFNKSINDLVNLAKNTSENKGE